MMSSDAVSTAGHVHPPGRRLRLLSYNIQAGLETGHYGHYLTRSWRHALPGRDMRQTLDRLAAVVSEFDFVALQEADAGSFRTLFRDQVEYLARRAGFAHSGLQVTRKLRPMAQHSLGFLSRLAPSEVNRYPLPGPIPGRNAMRIVFGPEFQGLTVLVTHLSLGSATRSLQLDYLSDLVRAGVPTLLMGDLNASAEELREHQRLRQSGLCLALAAPLTYPSWRPRRSLDHILASPEIEMLSLFSLPQVISDHLALAADVRLRGPLKP